VDGLLQCAEVRQPGRVGDDSLAVDDRILDLELPRGSTSPAYLLVQSAPVLVKTRISSGLLMTIWTR
jgi:hypothetical protein